jgi:hypothetical protein
MDEMSFDVVDDLNWLAVAVATAVYYLLAGPWFADPFFGPAWRQSFGWDKRAGERLGPGYDVGPLLTCLARHWEDFGSSPELTELLTRLRSDLVRRDQAGAVRQFHPLGLV